MKERPICTHCGYIGHTIDKCYKLHGYSPSYKPRHKSNSTTRMTHFANQVSETGVNATSSNMSNFVQMLNPSQHSHLMAMLSTHLLAAKISADVESYFAQATGTCLSILVNPIFHSSRYWIVDSGATSHICFSQDAFLSMKPV